MKLAKPTSRPAWTVVTHDGHPSAVAMLLRALARSGGSGSPVVVVDDSGDGRAEEALSRSHPYVHWLSLETSIGCIRARNLGVLHALGHGAEGVFLLDSSSFPKPGCFQTIMDVAQRHPHFGILGVIQKTSDGAPTARSAEIARTWPARALTYEEEERAPEVLAAQSVESPGLHARKEVFQATGFFDSLFSTTEFADADFCQRARTNGVSIGMATNAVIEVDGARTKPATSMKGWALDALIHAATSPTGSEAIHWRAAIQRAWGLALESASARAPGMAELATAIGKLARLRGALGEKVARDGGGGPCPLLSDGRPMDERNMAYRRWIERIELAREMKEAVA